MIRVPCSKSVLAFRIFLATALLAVVFLGQVYAQATSIGPGVAGQVHAAAYDPDHPDTLFVGGDVCGVYRSTNHGDTWELWSEGLENDDNTYSYYIDDLLVLGEDSGADVSRQGVYAATYGGLYFRGLGDPEWTLLSDYHSNCIFSYKGGWAGSKGAPIPFSALGYDSRNHILYAGTGYARKVEWGNHEFYPTVGGTFEQCSGDTVNQYSIFSLDCTSGSSSLTPRLDSHDVGRVWQITVSDHDGYSELVVAASNGLYSDGGPNKIDGFIEIWDESPQDLGPIGWSEVHWGVGAGYDGIVYTIATADTLNDIPAPPGIFRRDFKDAVADTAAWRPFGDLSQIVQPDDVTWQQVITSDVSDLRTLTVVPGDGSNQDRIYVGERRATEFGGYFRYGDYMRSGDGATVEGWTHILHVTGQWNEDITCHYYDWRIATEYELQVGWLTNEGVYSTTPLLVHPTQGNHMFAVDYHIPVASTSEGQQWHQVYSTSESEIGSSRGLNLMSTQDLAVDSSGQLVVGSRDFGAFRATSSGASDYSWLSWWKTTDNDAWIVKPIDTATESDLFVLRSAPSISNETWPQSRIDENIASKVIAVHDPLDHKGRNEWRHISAVIGDAYLGLPTRVPGGMYKITDMSFLGADTLFVSCNFEDVAGNVGKVFRGIRVASDQWTWQELALFPDEPGNGPIGRRTNFERILAVPHRSRVLLSAVEGHGNVGGLYAFSSDISTTATTGLTAWLDGTDQSLADSLRLAARNVTALAVDSFGETVYVGTRGVYTYDSQSIGRGTVLRCTMPFPGNAPNDWEVLANRDSPSFGYGVPTFLYPLWGNPADLEINHRLTHVRDIQLHPNNPHRAYVAIGPGGSFNPSNGIWELSADNSWTRVIGGGNDGVPAREMNCVAVNSDGTALYGGSAGQEAFEKQLDPIIDAPSIGERAEYALEVDIQNPVMTKFAVRVQSTSDYPIEEVLADTKKLNDVTGLRLTPLRDTGEFGDDFAGDGVYSTYVIVSEPVGANAAIRVVARDSQWNTSVADVLVDAIAPVGALADASESTGMLASPFTGDTAPTEGDPSSARMPTIAIPFNSDGQVDDPLPGNEDIIAGLESGQIQIFSHSVTSGGVPQFEAPTRPTHFVGEPPDAGSTSVSIADFDNDGYEDILCCNVNSAVSLFKYDPALGRYTDATVEVFQIPFTAQAAAWGDYNQDGWIDLVLVRNGSGIQPGPVEGVSGADASGPGADSPLLYRNDRGLLVLDQQTFFDAELATSFTVSWCDINGDGALDLFLGDYFGTPLTDGPRVFQNLGYAGNYQFTDVTSSWFDGDTTPQSVVAAEFADLDADGDADFVVASFNAADNLQVFENHEIDGGGGGQGVPALEILPQGETHIPSVDYGLSDFSLGDLDRNGYIDIVTMPNGTGNGPQVALNNLAGYPNRFAPVDVLDTTMQGYVSTGFIHDWGNNGLGEVYLGRDPFAGEKPHEMEKFFYKNDLTPQNDFIRVSLVGGGLCDYSALGARIDVFDHASGLRVAPAYWISGGNGRGRQNSRVLSVGLTRADGTPVDIQVKWPDGGVTTHRSPTQNGWAVNSPTVIMIRDYRMATINANSLDETKELTLNGIENWTFEWRATRPLEEAYVELNLDPYGTADPECTCGYGGTYLVLHESFPGVTFTITRLAKNSFEHTLVLDSWCCEECDYEFRVGGRFIDDIVSAWKPVKKVTTCLKDLPPPPPGP